MATATQQSIFITEDFLLANKSARVLYHDYVAHLPLIDYHNHLSPQDIAGDRQFINLQRIWLEGDHYKWRAMRTLGVREEFITGAATDREKFYKWAETLPYTLRNPLYHWSHLELKRYFDIDTLLTPSTAKAIYDECSEKLIQREFSTRSLIRKMNTEVICTTDDPIDTLEFHSKIRADQFDTKVLPAFRPDKAYAVENPAAYRNYTDTLSALTGVNIKKFDDLLLALENRIEFFHTMGCRISDHGLEQLPCSSDETVNLDKALEYVLDGGELQPDEINAFKYRMLLELGKMYHRKGWVQQFHLGALRNTNTRMLKQIGPDGGFDSIGDFSQGMTMAAFFNRLDVENRLAKTVVYNLNPSDNEVFASMIGNFNDGSVKGKMQFGSAWWFLDQKDGIVKQLNALSNLGLLSCFIGMLTDSRSFLSFPRHEYFRRVLCNLLGQDIENGELPNDLPWIGKIAADVCYHNAKAYFNF